MDEPSLKPLLSAGHATHCKRCLMGLPGSQVDVDPSKLALAFYCLGSLDLADQLANQNTKESDKETWRNWIWAQQINGPSGAAFRPGPYMDNIYSETSENPPHIIVTYTALLSLAILRDNFSRLDEPGVIAFLKACQNEDGSFSSEPYGGDADLRTTYCAFAISSMLDDWSGVRIAHALEYIASCRTYEGGYGQTPFSEGSGGPTYCALASIFLAGQGQHISDSQKKQTIRWLIQNQEPSGGYRGRTNKEADACYCFWCGASLAILGARELVNESALASFLSSCQFKFGGISKAPNEHPDPYHTYLSLAAVALYPLPKFADSDSWQLRPLDPLLNANEDTTRWAREHIPYGKA
ncbi:terpenoid cyclases protein prenyltransferase [Phlebopus sp. FC_14]|nr:terpenoid cyclases protein prenyltransferase [Phlebopus sp. FC_14]